MPISYPDILSLKTEGLPLEWRDKDAMLYALGVGMGSDPLDQNELPFVYENGLKAVPTLATVVAFGAGPLGRSGINFMMVVHGDQEVVFHRPFPPEGRVVADTTIPAVYDKGPKGAIIIQRTELKDEAGAPVATLTASVMARGDGGFGGPEHGAPEPHQVPERKPDLTIDIPTRPDQALLYRLCGDRNPLHADPGFAAGAGFDRPILHGLCTYGMVCKAVVDGLLDGDAARVDRFSARFAGVVFPGETLRTRVWSVDDRLVLATSVVERDAPVLADAVCTSTE